MALETTMDRLNIQLDDLLEQRQAFYNHMKGQGKENLICYYETHGGEKKLTLRNTEHEILCELMDLVYSTDAILARKEMVYKAMKEEGLR